MEFSAVQINRFFKQAIEYSHELILRSKLSLSTCTLCSNTCQNHPLLCQYCQAELPVFTEPIIKLDLLNWPAINALFPSRKFDHLISLAPYHWPFDFWLNQLKYQGRADYAHLLAYLLTQCWLERVKLSQPPLPEVIITVPLHLKKWQQRGFNQAHLITKIFAENVGITYRTNALIRTSHQPSQVGKSGAERRRSLSKAFELNPRIKLALPKHVLLIDDVVTTGATANEICQLLRRHGVQTITMLSVCLVLPG